MINLSDKLLEVLKEGAFTIITLVEIDFSDGNTLRFTDSPTVIEYDGNTFNNNMPYLGVQPSEHRGVVSRDRFVLSFGDPTREVQQLFVNNNKNTIIKLYLQFRDLHNNAVDTLLWTRGRVDNTEHTQRRNDLVTNLNCYGVFPQVSALNTRRTTKSNQALYDPTDIIFDYVDLTINQVWGPNS